MTTDGVTITFEIRLKAEAVAMFLQAIPTLLQGTTSFAGFRHIRIVQHKEDPTRILFIERWDSDEAYKKYMAWRTETGAMTGLASAVVSMETNIWPNLVIEA